MQYDGAQQRFGDNLRRVRKERGLTQERLALDTGLHRAYVGGLERGEYNATLGTLVHLARFLEVPVAELVDGADEAAASGPTRVGK